MPADKQFPAQGKMTCEEFAMAALDLDSAADSPLEQAAREHMRSCSHCAALQENWETLRSDLRVLGHLTSGVETPARVEMRLLQELRTKHKTIRARRAAVAATWALAAAAALVVAVSWVRWRQDQNDPATIRSNVVATATPFAQRPLAASTTGAELGQTLVATNDSSDFTLLPGVMPSPNEDATVVRVQMQRAALGALGLTVNEEHAADWIQVDLLVGDDGLPQAVRLPESSNW